MCKEISHWNECNIGWTWFWAMRLFGTWLYLYECIYKFFNRDMFRVSNKFDTNFLILKWNEWYGIKVIDTVAYKIWWLIVLIFYELNFFSLILEAINYIVIVRFYCFVLKCQYYRNFINLVDSLHVGKVEFEEITFRNIQTIIFPPTYVFVNTILKRHHCPYFLFFKNSHKSTVSYNDFHFQMKSLWKTPYRSNLICDLNRHTIDVKQKI